MEYRKLSSTEEKMIEQNHDQAQLPTSHCVWSHLLWDETGQDLIEYALVAAIVGLGAIASLKGLSTKIGNIVQLGQQQFNQRDLSIHVAPCVTQRF